MQAIPLKLSLTALAFILALGLYHSIDHPSQADDKELIQFQIVAYGGDGNLSSPVSAYVPLPNNAELD